MRSLFILKLTTTTQYVVIGINKNHLLELTVEDVMTKDPLTGRPDSPSYDALNIMEQYQITVLPITDPSSKVLGVLHLHDILGKGAFKFNGT